MRAAFWIAIAWLAAADADSSAAKPEPGKVVTRPFKVASVDVKSHRIEVKEAGFEIVWHETKTRFYHHRSVLLKDLAEGAALEVFGKRHEEHGDDAKKSGKRTDPLVSDIELIGTGDAFQRPALTSRAGGVAWEKGKLAVKQPPAIEIEKKRYRLAGDDKLAAYSVEKLAPEKLAPGLRVIIRGNARKLTVERDGKSVEVTRIYATAIHLVELGAEHARIFQAEWVERKKAPDPAGPARSAGSGKGAEGAEAEKGKRK